MQCPECDGELSSMTVGSIAVDVCKDGCGGIWFDAFELQKFEALDDSAGEALLDIVPASDIEVDMTRRFDCPKCTDTVLMRHFFSTDRKVVVDECPSCGGFWLDPGELREIRDLHETDEARQQAASEYFDEVFGKQVEAEEAEADAEVARSQHFAHMFKFICPSYYVPGKQGWGAF